MRPQKLKKQTFLNSEQILGKQWKIIGMYVNVENMFCMPESFNTNISHQLFYYIITFENPQHLNTNSKGDFVLKTSFKRSFY